MNGGKYDRTSSTLMELIYSSRTREAIKVNKVYANSI